MNLIYVLCCCPLANNISLSDFFESVVNREHGCVVLVLWRLALFVVKIVIVVVEEIVIVVVGGSKFTRLLETDIINSYVLNLAKQVSKRGKV